MERQLHTNPDRATSRVAIYEDQALCTKLLDSVTAAVPPQILPSKIVGAGAGLFVTRDVDVDEEIFRSRPMVNCVDNKMQKLVCDNCYTYEASFVYRNEYFHATGDSKPEMKACSGCKVCYYCSKVSINSAILILHRKLGIWNGICADCLQGLSKEGLETIPQIRMLDVLRDAKSGTP
jgi:hypothetical protein